MDNYLKFIQHLTEFLTKCTYIDKVKSIYVGGSVARGDYRVGTSDIDLYIVCQGRDRYIQMRLENDIQTIATSCLGELLSWCSEGVSIEFTTYEQIKEGISWLGTGADYYSFKESAKLLYGEDIRGIINEPDKIQIKYISHVALNQLKEIVNQPVPDAFIVEASREFLRGLFSTAFATIHFEFAIKDKYIRDKGRLVEALLKEDLDRGRLLEEVYVLWNLFAERELSKDEIKLLINNTRQLLE